MPVRHKTKINTTESFKPEHLNYFDKTYYRFFLLQHYIYTRGKTASCTKFLDIIKKCNIKSCGLYFLVLKYQSFMTLIL
jgi:hypothetical protein